VSALGEFLDHLPVERGKVLALTIGDEAVVHNHFLVHALRAGVVQVRLDRVVGADLASRHDGRVDQGPGRMADRGHRLAVIEEGPHELLRRRHRSQLVRVHRPPGRSRASQSAASAPGGTCRPTRVIQPFPPASAGETTCVFATGSSSAPGHDQLDLLEAIRHKDGDLAPRSLALESREASRLDAVRRMEGASAIPGART
jgi:hypothetical protein